MISQAKMEQTRTGVKLSFLASTEAEEFASIVQKRIDDDVRSRMYTIYTIDDVEVAKIGPTPRGLINI